MDNIFDVFNISENKTEYASIEEKSKGPFDITKDIYSIINRKSKNYEDEINAILNKYQEGDLGFVVWIMNKNLVHIRSLRRDPSVFTGLPSIFGNKRYIYFYVFFMIKSNITFPNFMAWYKADIDAGVKKYSNYLKKMKSIEEDEFDELLKYCNLKCISVKDLCLNINALNNIIIKGEIF